MAMPGEELARFITAEGDRGDSTDDDLPAMARNLLRPGAYVQSVVEFYIAKLYGYVCLVDDEISILPPIWLTPERMQAHFICLPPLGPEVTGLNDRSMRQLLQQCEVSHGLKVDGLEKLLLQPEAPETAEAILLAEGTPSVDAEATNVTLKFLDGEAEAAGTREGVSHVAEGELLAEITPPKAGKRGFEVTGLEISTRDVQNATLMAGDNVRAEDRDGITCLFAEREGRANIRNQVLSIRPVAIIDGDLKNDMEVEEDPDVHIRGSLKSGTKLTARGAILIDGMVENGAQVESEDEVRVAGGVEGSEARVAGAGDVSVGFVRKSNVTARGNLTIGDRSEDAVLQVGGGWLSNPQAAGESPVGPSPQGPESRLASSTAGTVRRCCGSFPTSASVPISPRLSEGWLPAALTCCAFFAPSESTRSAPLTSNG